MKIADKKAVLAELENLYPDAKPALRYTTPYELLVAVILSAQCTDERVNKVTKILFEKKQVEVREAHKKVEVLKKLKEKQEQEYYKEFLDLEVKETDDITSARFGR